MTSLEGQDTAKFFEVQQNPVNGRSGIRWAADGRSILYINAGNDVTRLTRQALEGSPSEDLVSFSREEFYSFDQSAEGRFVYSRGLRTSDAVLITDSR